MIDYDNMQTLWLILMFVFLFVRVKPEKVNFPLLFCAGLIILYGIFGDVINLLTEILNKLS